ncbi:macrolide family glycosyltransferase [Amycolatopsis sp. NPDC101161]|uniref:macrolide family glycosyltransferase n=1 Tax=Amycolatopsis sp. NPDC101161 TaxID=3363940 RepID=UPI0037FD325D
MTQGRHLAFFSFPGVGHINPMLGPVEALAERGHRVTFFVAEPFAHLLRDSSAETVVYHSDFPASVTKVDSAEDAVTMIIDLMREGFAPLEAALERLSGDRPDLIVHDTISGNAARVLGRAWDVPLAESCPVFIENDADEIPGAPQPPDDHPAATDFDHRDPRLARFGEEFGAGVSALLTRYGLDPRLATDSLSPAGDELRLVYIPQAFHYGSETFGERYRFVGPTADCRALQGHWTPPGDGRPVVLISLGTSMSKDLGFFTGCIEAFRGKPWHVVLTLGRGADLAALGELPPNVEAHEWMPHPSVLRYASALVCQAGMGSVLEALRYEVPVVAVSHSGETLANAHRVAELGLGTHIPVASATGAAIHAAVEALAADGALTARLALMAKEIEQAGGAPAAADALETLLP